MKNIATFAVRSLLLLVFVGGQVGVVFADHTPQHTLMQNRAETAEQQKKAAAAAGTLNKSTTSTSSLPAGGNSTGGNDGGGNTRGGNTTTQNGGSGSSNGTENAGLQSAKTTTIVSNGCVPQAKTNDLVPLFAPPNSSFAETDAICQIKGVKCIGPSKPDEVGTAKCTIDPGAEVICDFEKLLGKERSKNASIGILGTACEIASIGLASTTNSESIQKENCASPAGAAESPNLDSDSWKNTVGAATGGAVNGGSESPTQFTNEPRKDFVGSSTSIVDLVCTDFLDPIPLKMLQSSFKEAYCVEVQPGFAKRQPGITSTQTQQPTGPLMKFINVSGPNAAPGETLCYGILTKTGQLSVVAGFFLFAFQTIQAVLIGLAIIGIIVSGIQMMYSGGSEEAKKNAMKNLGKILGGLALLFFMKIFLITVAPDFFTIS